MKSYLLNSLLIATLGFTLSACDKQSTENANEIIVKIGSVAPVTGPQTHIGKDNENGAQMAVDEANAQGIMLEGKKAKFVLLSEDDAADPIFTIISFAFSVDCLPHAASVRPREAIRR